MHVPGGRDRQLWPACAISGERTLPVLDAAHIKAYSVGGRHEVSNGSIYSNRLCPGFGWLERDRM